MVHTPRPGKIVAPAVLVAAMLVAFATVQAAVAACGDGVVDVGESCDRGGRTPGDGCSATCQIEAGPLRPDSDGDGLDDLAELAMGDSPLGRALRDLVAGAASTERTTDERLPAVAATPIDSDGDGLPDDLELIFGSDPNDPDTDDDGLGDAFEVTSILQWGIGAPADADQDDDGLDDLHDDFDGDGIANDVEFTLGTSVYLPDSDFDGLSDGDEESLGLNPLAHDSNADGIRDSDEDADVDGLGIVRERSAGTDASLPDTDGDEVDDGAEIVLCTDPLRQDSASDAVCLGRASGGVPDWKLFQRGADGRTSIRVPFRYRLAQAGRLEAAVVDAATGTALRGHDYADHAMALPAFIEPEGTPGQLDVEGVPQGGNYDLRIRVVEPATGAVLTSDVARSLAVGDVFLAAGQSNMTGNNGWWEPPALWELPDPMVHLFGNDGRWKLAVEPIDDAADSIDPVSIDGLARSSPMLRFAKEVARASGVPIAIIPAPASGSRLGGALAGPHDNRWVRDPTAPYDRSTLYGSAVSRVLSQSYSESIRGIIWYQGESNGGQSSETYRDALATFVADLRSDLANPSLFFASCQLAWRGSSDPGTQNAWMAIQEGQRQYARSDLQSVLVGTIDLPGDGLHLFGPGYREAGRRLAMATLRAVAVYRGRTARPPLLVRTRLQSAGRRIALSFDRRVTGSDPALFQTIDGPRVVAATAVRARGRRVIVDLAEPVGAEARLTYGRGATLQHSPVVGARGEGAAVVFRDLEVGIKLE